MKPLNLWNGFCYIWPPPPGKPLLAPGVEPANLAVPVKPYIDDEYPPILIVDGQPLMWEHAAGGAK